MTNAHAFLPPSGAARWTHCAYAPTLEALYPELEDSPASREGTAAHWVAQQLIEHGEFIVEGATAPNGEIVTGEMEEGAEMYHDALVAALGDGGPNWANLQIEQRVEMPVIHAQNWGTPDAFVWYALPDGRECLHVFDYKFGHGFVDAYENWQLLDYAFGCGPFDRLRPAVIRLTVVQPRNYHHLGPVRTWQLEGFELDQYGATLQRAAEAATAPRPVATPHPEACKHCSGRHACAALQRAAYDVVELSEQGAPHDLTPHGLGLELRALTRARALLDARVSGLEEQATALLRGGERVPFWFLESAPGRLAWTRPAAEIIAAGNLLGVDLRKPDALLTPTQAKKLVPPDVLDAYAARPPGSAKLTYDDGTKARLTFASSNT